MIVKRLKENRIDRDNDWIIGKWIGKIIITRITRIKYYPIMTSNKTTQFCSSNLL